MPETTIPKSAKGFPLWVWVAAGLGAIVVGYFFLRPSSGQNATASTQGGSGGTNVDAYAALLNQESWMNANLQNIEAQIAAIGSTQGASAPPPPPSNPPPDKCCKPGVGILCAHGVPYCNPSLNPGHDGSGVISPGTLALVGKG